MNNLKIKTKLILLFIIIKVVPLILISYIAIEGAAELNKYFEQTTKSTFNKSKEIIKTTATTAISDSIKALDNKSQSNLERLSYEIANDVATFLYERDKDLLVLSSLDLNENILKDFRTIKTSPIIVHGKYNYNEDKQKWEAKKITNNKNIPEKSELEENSKEFNVNRRLNVKTLQIPLYKEIQVIDLDGNEIYKVSSISNKKINIKNKKDTYSNAEDYFEEITKLKKGEIFVSNVIGEYIKTDVIGTYTKEKIKKMGKKFDPQNSAYAGKENPVGKEFKGIVRFATPIYKNNKKVGYVAFALNHKHIMEFTEHFDPLVENTKQEITDASTGNYAFMWDNIGRNISHPRNYFIVGYDKNTGEQVPGWLSLDVAEKFKQSEMKNLNKFLKNYPQFEEQSLKKKANIEQLKTTGQVALDCRYLNFAPQCNGWMQLTKDGGYGSFIIFWSGVEKLTTAATIPYYTGQYGSSKRGFGIVTIGANVKEFHQAANQTKENVNAILEEQVDHMKQELDENKFNVFEYIHRLVQELLALTFVMVFTIIAIAIWMSNLITNKISNLLKGIKEYSHQNFSHKIEVTSNDEIGELEESFNTMAKEIKELIDTQANTNILLDMKVKEANSASKAKSEFLASMSHEIRTPLNPILGFIDILREQEENTQKREYLSIIQKSGNNLLLIINDILDFSKIESDKVKIDCTNINPYKALLNTAEQFLIITQKKNLTLEINISKDLSQQLYVDLLKLTQVINNLISNAIKFTPENGKVTLDISYDNHKQELYVSVEDTGIGISKDKQEMIFEPFAQEDTSTTRKYGGTGLGLSISKKLVTLMGGNLQLEKDKEKGSRFYFSIIIENKIEKNSSKKEFDDSEELTVLENQLESILENKKIMIVEDNPANQVFMKILMKKISLDYEIAKNGLEAVELYKKERFDLILMDENMPILSGSEATLKIREIEKTTGEHIPIIALTANALIGDKDRFLKVGMDDYLSKPLLKKDLEKILNKYLK
jgi:signal transduction histidine kinase/CheY-like chemotaxis protein